MSSMAQTTIANFIWGIADDVLRDIYVRGKYRDVILPMTVIRRLDALLEPTKEAPPSPTTVTPMVFCHPLTSRPQLISSTHLQNTQVQEQSLWRTKRGPAFGVGFTSGKPGDDEADAKLLLAS